MIHTRGKLIVNLHGFAAPGHRTVTFNTNTLGRPIGEARTLVSWNYQHVPGFDLGRPFGVTTLPDGSLIVSDDVNHALMRVSFKTPAPAIPVSVGRP
jgi:glucose/arabinose dehydrogenase